MAKIRIKLRLSTVPGRAGTVYYQISHKKRSKTDYHQHPFVTGGVGYFCWMH